MCRVKSGPPPSGGATLTALAAGLPRPGALLGGARDSCPASLLTPSISQGSEASLIPKAGCSTSSCPRCQKSTTPSDTFGAVLSLRASFSGARSQQQFGFPRYLLSDTLCFRGHIKWLLRNEIIKIFLQL